MMWTLDDALTFIREIQPQLKEKGWYIALAGGVLNNGVSEHDLDLVAVPYSSERADINVLRRTFKSLGFRRRADVLSVHEVWRKRGSDDRKHVEVWASPCGRRVDIITPSVTV